MVQTKQQTVDNTKLVYVENAPNQTPKVNALINTVDMLSQNRVLDILNSPPGGIVHSDVYLVGTSPSGAWAGKANHLVGYYDGSYQFHLPMAGYELHVVDEGVRKRYTGSAWVLAIDPITSVAKTADFTASTTEAGVYLIDATAGDVDVAIPAASTVPNRTIRFKRTDASGNAVTFDLAIDGVTSSTLATGAFITIYSDGTNWWKI